jgi:hypothetical protein
MNDDGATAALISDLHWQIDQLGPRGIKDAAGNPYNPSYYKRGLQNAIDRGGLAVAQYVRRYVYKPPSDGYKKLEEADSLDLACEALVADEDRPYAYLFSAEDRQRARTRLAPHMAAIERRKEARRQRVAAKQSMLSEDIDQLRAAAADAKDPEVSIAINQAILKQAPRDIVALNRLGRAYESVGLLTEAREAFASSTAIDETNPIARRRLHDLDRLLARRAR